MSDGLTGGDRDDIRSKLVNYESANAAGKQDIFERLCGLIEHRLSQARGAEIISGEPLALNIEVTGGEPIPDFIGAMLTLVNHQHFENIPRVIKRDAMKYLVDSVIGD